MLATKDIAWAAGFLEGEGWFGCAGKRSLVIAASQVNPEPLHRLTAIFGGNVHGPYLGGKGNRNPYYEWRNCGHRAAGIMMTLFVLLSAKRRAQVRAALALWKEAKGPYQYRTHCRNGHPYDEANTRLVSRAGRANKSRGCRACQRQSDRRHRERQVMAGA